MEALCYNRAKVNRRQDWNMKVKLYTIPIKEAFNADCECPICYMRSTLESKAVDFTMGPSYMDDTIRAETDKVGFCNHHIQMLYQNQNRLGLALILKTHMDKTIQDLEKLLKKETPLSSPSIFKKTSGKSGVITYTNQLECSCYICNSINDSFDRYIDTIFSLVQNDSEFYDKFSTSKGFCTNHYRLLYEQASKHLKGDKRDDFIDKLNSVYINNFKRVRDDLDWFINKFDYRYVDEPWKDSKDALPRAITKVNGILS